MKLIKSIWKGLLSFISPVGIWLRKQNIIIKILLLLCLILLLGAAGVFGLIHRYYRMSDYAGFREEGPAEENSQTDAADDIYEGNYIIDAEPLGSEAAEDEISREEAENTEDKEKDGKSDGTGLTPEEEAALIAEAEAAQQTLLFPENSSVYNILLIGVDQRKEGGYANSDSMILLSLNKETRRILMISFMRDLYCNIEGVGVRKLNSAHAKGGPELLVKTIEENYKVDIDNYAKVNFYTMIDIVDKVGGIELEITEEELPYVNRYVRNLCGLAGVRAKKHYLSSPGTYICDGYQTVAYSRIRYVGSDYQRTQRQRTVLTRLIEKARTMNLLELNDLVNTVLPDITHDISEVRMLRLLSGVPAFLTYDIAQSRVPYKDLYVSRNEILYPDMEATIARLQEEIYGQSYLAPTLSAQMSAESAPYTDSAESVPYADSADDAEAEETQAGTAWWEQVSEPAAESSEEASDTDHLPVDKELYYVKDSAADGTVVWQPTLRDKLPGSWPLSYPAGGTLICEEDWEVPADKTEGEEEESEED